MDQFRPIRMEERYKKSFENFVKTLKRGIVHMFLLHSLNTLKRNVKRGEFPALSMTRLRLYYIPAMQILEDHEAGDYDFVLKLKILLENYRINRLNRRLSEKDSNIIKMILPSVSQAQQEAKHLPLAARAVS